MQNATVKTRHGHTVATFATLEQATQYVVLIVRYDDEFCGYYIKQANRVVHTAEALRDMCPPSAY